MLRICSLTALICITASGALGAVWANCEAEKGYVAGFGLVGQDNWVLMTSSDANANAVNSDFVTPDSVSGYDASYGAVLEGLQSALHGTWGTTVARPLQGNEVFQDGSTISVLMKPENDATELRFALFSDKNAVVDPNIYPAVLAVGFGKRVGDGNIPIHRQEIGVWVKWPDNKWHFQGSGQYTHGKYNSVWNMELGRCYKFEIVLSYSTSSYTVYVTDMDSTYVSAVNIGTYSATLPSQTALRANGCIGISCYGGVVVFDSIQVSQVPTNCAEVRDNGLIMPFDLNEDCAVNFKDAAILFGNWLACNNPLDTTCEQNWLP